MSFGAYLKSVLFEFIMLLCVVIALESTFLDVFYIAPSLQYSAIPLAVSAVLLVILFASSYNRRMVRLGGVVYALLCIVLLGVSIVLSKTGLLADAEGNYLYFTLTIVLITTGAFLLSRRRVGTVFLFLVGTFICAWVQFFYERYEIIALLIFVLSALALIIYRNYQLSAHSATTVRRFSSPAGAGVAVVSVLLAVGVGVGIWFGLIAPLHPGAFDIKLITEYRALQTLQVQGVSNVYQTPNTSMTSKNTNSDQRTTDDMKVASDGTPVPAHYSGGDTQQQQHAVGSFLGVDTNSLKRMFDFQASPQTATPLFVLILLIPLVVIAYFIGRVLFRRKKLKRIRALTPEQQVDELYRFFVSRFGRLGVGLPTGTTVFEYVENNSPIMSRFDTKSGVSFGDLTDTFVRVAYGAHGVSQSQADGFSEFYRGFWKASRKYLGNIRYFFKAFRL